MGRYMSFCSLSQALHARIRPRHDVCWNCGLVIADRNTANLAYPTDARRRKSVRASMKCVVARPAHALGIDSLLHSSVHINNNIPIDKPPFHGLRVEQPHMVCQKSKSFIINNNNGFTVLQHECWITQYLPRRTVHIV